MINGNDYPAYFLILFTTCVSFAFCQSPEHNSNLQKQQTTTTALDSEFIDTGDIGRSSSIINVKQDSLKKNLSAVDTNNAIAATYSGIIQKRQDSTLFHIDTVSKKMFKTIGDYHHTAGIYHIVEGVFVLLAGSILINKENYTSFSMTLMAIGGISTGIGIWEIKIGSSLTKNSSIK
jgi:hypothetical protein